MSGFFEGLPLEADLGKGSVYNSAEKATSLVKQNPQPLNDILNNTRSDSGVV